MSVVLLKVKRPQTRLTSTSSVIVFTSSSTIRHPQFLLEKMDVGDVEKALFAVMASEMGSGSWNRFDFIALQHWVIMITDRSTSRERTSGPVSTISFVFASTNEMFSRSIERLCAIIERQSEVVFLLAKKLVFTMTLLLASSVTVIFAPVWSGDSAEKPLIPAPQEMPIPLL